MTITIDKAGRVVIPKVLRDEMNLAPGDAFELDSEGEKIILRPVRDVAPLFKKQGVWVYKAGSPLSSADTDDVLRHVREEREELISGISR